MTPGGPTGGRDPPPPLGVQPLEIVVNSVARPESPCLLNINRVRAGEHQVTIIGESGLVRVCALVAIQHDMLVAIWHMAHTGELYADPGADYYQRLHPDRARRRALAQLEHLGYDVHLTKAS